MAPLFQTIWVDSGSSNKTTITTALSLTNNYKTRNSWKLYTDHKLGRNNPFELGQINCHETAAYDLYTTLYCSNFRHGLNLCYRN